MDDLHMKRAFLAGYMQKSAAAGGLFDKLTGAGGAVVGAGTDLAKYLVDKAGLIAAAAPVGLGVGAAALASKATSPGKRDIKAIQNQMLTSELQEFYTDLKRKQKLRKKGINQVKEEDEGRSIRV